MKILILTTSFPLVEHSTSGLFIQHLVEHLATSVDITILTPGHTMDVKPPVNAPYQLKWFRYAPKSWQKLAHEPGGIPVALKNNPLLFLLLPVFLISMTFSCLRLARNVDVIHANWSVNGVIAGIAGLLTGTPVITTLRGSDVRRALDSWIEGYLLKLCLYLNDRVVAVSHAMRKIVKKKFPRFSRHLLTIPNGVSKTFLEITPHDTEKNRPLRLISIGNLIPQKGLDTVLSALGQSECPNDFLYYIIGEGIEKQRLIDLASQLHISEQVKFLGNISNKDLPAHLQYMDMLILSSYGEGRPNVVMEAMAAGIPVIASHIDGVKELIQDETSGLLFEAGNVAHLARQLERLKNNPCLRHTLGTSGRQFILQNGLTWDKAAFHYINIYLDLTKGKRMKV
ncbi:MAG: glycosyltransferase family 4 protein [Candidatus Magnetomorum sp.]|nr:glycosyltransferase family 4 protein [Candidatus Magnetomorum sp.]